MSLFIVMLGTNETGAEFNTIDFIHLTKKGHAQPEEVEFPDPEP